MERIDWKGVIIPKVNELLGSYSYRPTLRQIFYRLVAALLIPNTESTYKSLSRATVAARETDIIDPLCFEDRVRTHTQGDYGFGSPDDFIDYMLDQLRDSPDQYTRPLWSSQQTMPIIWLEKDALFTPVSEIAGRYRVKVYAARGNSSLTAVYEAAQEIRRETISLKVLQLSDFDESGEDMVRDLEDRLTRYGATDYELAKIALTPEQVTQFNLPTMMAKTKADGSFANPLHKKFAASYGDQVVELDALPPDELDRIVSTAIEELIDQDAWQAEEAKAKQEKEEAQRRIEELLDQLE
ncbi:hypothetical protein ES705_22921 [subsurface metagenome]